MLTSDLLPDMNSAAVTPFTTTPMAATTITVSPPTGSDDCRRWMASSASAPIANSSSMALASAARMEARAQP